MNDKGSTDYDLILQNLPSDMRLVLVEFFQAKFVIMNIVIMDVKL